MLVPVPVLMAHDGWRVAEKSKLDISLYKDEELAMLVTSVEKEPETLMASWQKALKASCGKPVSFSSRATGLIKVIATEKWLKDMPAWQARESWIYTPGPPFI